MSENLTASKTFLAYCSVSPMSKSTYQAAVDFLTAQHRHGLRAFDAYPAILGSLHRAAAQLLKTSADNICFVDNTAMGMSLIANGYPFSPGDQIVTYCNEYPSNYYPWKLQEKLQGAKLVELSDCDPLGNVPAKYARSWSLDELERVVTLQTKVVAISHVQFTSGFAADLIELGSFCQERGIDLVIDAAQSLGSLPVYPEQMGISAIACSGWKWLCGPLGAGLMYCSPELREKLADVIVGSDSMRQGTNYLDHTWAPHQSSRRFEFSTVPLACAVGLECAIREQLEAHTAEEIRDKIFKLQDSAIKQLDCALYRPLLFPAKHRSGILSLIPKKAPEEIVAAAYRQGVVVTARDGYLRLAPHFFTSSEEITKGVEVLNSVG